MPSRLVLAALMPRDVVARAREEFDAVVVEGKDDMTAAQVIEAAVAHRADAIMFTNTLPLIRRCHRAPAAERARRCHQQRRLRPHRRGGGEGARPDRDQHAGRADRMHRRLRVHDAAGGGAAGLPLRQDHARRLALSHRAGRTPGCAGDRQDARHPRDGAHRAGGGAAGARLRHDGGVSFAQPAAARSSSRARDISPRSTTCCRTATSCRCTRRPVRRPTRSSTPRRWRS